MRAPTWRALPSSQLAGRIVFAVCLVIVVFADALETPTTTTTTTTTSSRLEESWIKPKEAERQPERDEVEPAEEAASNDCGLQLVRLPSWLRPTHYDLLVVPNMEELSFEGAVQIDLKFSRHPTQVEPALGAAETRNGSEGGRPSASQIVLHADESLRVENIWFTQLGSNSTLARQTRALNRLQTGGARLIGGADEEHVKVRNVCRDQAYQLLVISLAQELSPNSLGKLHLTFAGQLSDDMRAFYKSAYRIPSSNKTRYHATTQFQATEARRVFPCFDEPAFKATFDLTLLHPSDRISLANTAPLFERPLEAGRPGEASRLLVRFARTPPMSTYLLAFVVGEFHSVQRSLEGNRLLVRVFTPLGRSQEGQFALSTACNAIQLMQHYFNIPFPLQKLDLVSIPDFEAGAMENWGLITFKETQLLLDEENTSPSGRALVASTVVHELAHQWFGNLVTMQWWNDLWLNEGFATWMEYELVERLFPEMDFNFRYLLDSHIHAMNEDSSRFTHPIQQPEWLNETDQIDEMFDMISYNKAAAIVRILHDDFVGPNAFRAAIRSYMWTNKYDNTNTSNLWHFMELASNRSVKPLMQSWLNQPGYPLIRCEFNGTRNEISLSQERFLTGGVELNGEEMKQHWIVPISMLVSGGDRQREQVLKFTLNSGKGRQVQELPSWFNGSAGGWLKLNANFSGFYRVKYPIELLRLMRVPIERAQMSPIDRLNILDEAQSLVLAGELSGGQLVEILSWFKLDQHGAILDSKVAALEVLLRLFGHRPDLGPRLRQFGRSLLSGAGGFVASEGEEGGHIEEIGRSAALGALVRLGHQPTISEALAVFESGARVATFLRAPLYAAVARAGSESQFKRLFALFERSGSQEERARIGGALARTSNASRLERVWSWLKRPQTEIEDKMEIVGAMLASNEGQRFALKLLEFELDTLVKLNRARPLLPFIEQLCLSMGARSFPEMSNFFERHDSVAQWRPARDYIERELAWHLTLELRDAASIERALKLYLPPQVGGGGGGGPQT